MWKKNFLILSVFILLSLFFLINQEGIWLYLDLGWKAINDYKSKEYIYSTLSTLGNGTFFLFDASILHSTRFINEIIINYFPQIIIYIIYFISCYIISYNLISIKFEKKYSIYGALFFTFNPVSIYFLQQIGFIFAYISLPLIILGIYNFFLKKKKLYLIVSFLGFYCLMSYTRLTGLYGLFLIIIGLYYFSFIKDLFIKEKKNLIIFILTHILIFLPFIFSFIYQYIGGEKEYFSGLSNHAVEQIKYSSFLYNDIKNNSFLNGFYIKEISDNFGLILQKSYIFITLGIILNLGLILLFFYHKNNKINLGKYLILILMILIFIRITPHFISENNFEALVYKIFPFIAGNIKWIYVIYIPIIAYLIVYNIENFKNNKIKLTLIYIVILYSLYSILPLIDYKNNVKLKTLETKNIPNSYKDTLYKNDISKNASLFFPGNNIYFNWSPYPLLIENNTLYQTLFTNNSRLVNQKQANLNNTVNNLKEKNNIENNSIFNLKNIFVFKDIKNAKNGQFDFYEIKDYVGESKLYYDKFINDKNLYIKQDNENFAQFGLKNDDKYEFFLYAPRKIERKDMDKFFSTGFSLDITKKPINLDPTSFHKPIEIDNFQVPQDNQNIAIRYKRSVLQPTKIYAKFGNIDISQPFLVQLNQTFGMSWKVKWITKEEFEEKPCVDEYSEFPITQNKYCNYKPQILDIRDTKYLNRSSVPESQHFEGNFVGNTWLIQPQDIPENMRGQKELYAVIIYEKQIWYNWALIISGMTFVLLLFATVFQEIKNYTNRKSTKNKA